MNSAPSTVTRTGAPSFTQPGNLQTVWLIAEREITTKLRTKSFIISTLIMLVLVFAAVLFSGLTAQGGLFSSTTQVAVTSDITSGPNRDISESLTAAEIELVEVVDRTEAVALVEDGSVDAALVSGGDSEVGFTIIGDEGVPSILTQLLSITPNIEILNPVTDSPVLAMMIGLAFGVIWMMSAMTFGVQIAQSVVEEKQTRIVEILLASVRPTQLLSGKILGNSILALGSVFLILAVAAVGMLITGQVILLGGLGGALVWVGILFIFGFVLVASLYGALGSLVSRQEEIGAVTSPLMMIIMAPYILVILFFDNPLVLSVMSYIPFSAPVGMPMRLYLGQTEWWEPVLSLGILVVTIAMVVWVGARIYSGSILRTGTRVKLRDALKGN